MALKSSISRILASQVAKKVRKDASRSVSNQEEVRNSLLKSAASTLFGKEHSFSEIVSHRDFTEAIPVRDYEAFMPYISQVKDGLPDILWPGRPLYFCKTSGTTSGTKYIPLTKESMPNHIGSARNALLMYIAETGRAGFVDGKMIFLQGSPVLEKLPSGIPFGRLSGIVANHVPAYLQRNRMPSFKTNCINDWEEKVEAIVKETAVQDMRLISGIPTWVQMYFESLLRYTGKSTVRDVFPHFDLFVYGGVNFDPYRKKFSDLIGKTIPSIELYPASEGFIAYQDSQDAEGLLLNTNSGIYFEFIPAAEFFDKNPRRLSLADVKTGENYALVLSNNAGLWSYSIGDTVRFVSLDPPRIKVTGRIKHFTSAFGEHVIAEEVERAMSDACNALGIQISEFHVAPQVEPLEGLPYHEWFIESDEKILRDESLAEFLDTCMKQQNIYYRDLLHGNVLRPLKLTFLKKGSFNEYMRSVGKLGGQNKVPRLANDRKIADGLLSASENLR